MEVQDEPGQPQEGVEGQAGDGAGVPYGEADATAEQEGEGGSEGRQSNETLAVQKRLKSQRRAHEREVRELHARIGDLESRIGQPAQEQQPGTADPYGQPNGGSVDETIQKAVGYALRQREVEERKARDAQQAAHVQRSYQDFQKHLDGMGDKYDDFHDVVFGQDTPYTTSMRDYALTLPRNGKGSAGEVLYRLGKNRPELDRIRQLHPLDQASELMKLSHALIGNGSGSEPAPSRPLGQIKSNPAISQHAVTERTPVASIRERMRSGNWK